LENQEHGNSILILNFVIFMCKNNDEVNGVQNIDDNGNPSNEPIDEIKAMEIERGPMHEIVRKSRTDEGGAYAREQAD
jgi:hypothetical protein